MTFEEWRENYDPLGLTSTEEELRDAWDAGGMAVKGEQEPVKYKLQNRIFSEDTDKRHIKKAVEKAFAKPRIACAIYLSYKATNDYCNFGDMFDFMDANNYGIVIDKIDKIDEAHKQAENSKHVFGPTTSTPTSETTKKIEVMHAYGDGAEIEYANYGKNDWVLWEPEDGCEPEWNWGIMDYRIKPEPLGGGKMKGFLSEYIDKENYVLFCNGKLVLGYDLYGLLLIDEDEQYHRKWNSICAEDITVYNQVKDWH